jgi:DNA primase
MPRTTTSNLFALLAADVPLRKVANTQGGEYAGPCPFCGGTDRFRVWPKAGLSGRYKCMGYAEGRNGCGRAGDAIQYLRDREGLGFQEACVRLGIDQHQWSQQRPDQAPAVPERLEPPSSTWQTAGWQLVQASIEHLHAPAGAKALAWLQGRGLDVAIIRHARLGYNPLDQYQDRTLWGLSAEHSQTDKPQTVWLPRGIVIPWMIQGELWRVNIRRPVGDPKYVGPAGWKNALYLVDQFGADAGGSGVQQRPVVLVEGEVDALTVYQHAGDLVAAVATGSTGGARQLKWLAWLAAAPLVLVAYDADEPGEKAAAYWRDVLPNARRWRPFWQDANAMAQAGADVRRWIEVGLGGPIRTESGRDADGAAQ